MVIWSKSFYHDHGQNFQSNLGQMVKIFTMTMAKIEIFHGQNGTLIFFNHEFDLRMPYLTIDHGEKSEVSMVKVKFFDH